MSKLLLWTGRLAGALGVALAVVAVVCRALGMWRIGDLQIGTLLQAGIAAMVLGTLAYAAVLAERKRN